MIINRMLWTTTFRTLCEGDIIYLQIRCPTVLGGWLTVLWESLGRVSAENN